MTQWAMWESASAHMDGRRRDRGDVVLFRAGLCLSVGFAMRAKDVRRSGDASLLNHC